MTPSVIKNLFYSSPYAPLPPGVGTAGITLETDPEQSPTPAGIKDPVLVFRLRLMPFFSDTIAVSPTGEEANVKIATLPLPISPTESYIIDLIWVKRGAPEPSIKWNEAIASAPVTAAQVAILSASFDGESVTAQLEYGSNSGPLGAQVNVYSFSNGKYVSVGSNQTQTNTVTVPVKRGTLPPVYFLSAQAAITTINTGGAGSFAPPFSLGPPTPITAYSIPQAIKKISSAVYNDKSLTLSWELNTVQNCVAPDSSRIHVLSNGNMVGSFTGSPLSAIIPVDVYAQPGITIEVSSVSNNIGSEPVSFSLITEPPVVTNVVANKSAGKITANVTTTPANLPVQAYLMNGNTRLAGPVSDTAGVVSFDYSTNKYNAEGMVGLSIIANTISADKIVTGPQSKPAVMLSTAPALKSANIYTDPANSANWRIELNWDRLPDAAQNVISYTAAIVQNNVSLSSQTTSGTSATMSIAKSAIDSAHTQIIQLSATGITGGTSPMQSLFALFTAPVLSSLTSTQNQVAAAWTAPEIPAGNMELVLYRLIVLANGTVVHRGSETTSTQAAISLSDVAVPAGGNIVLMVSVALGPVTLQPDTGMPIGTSASPILSAPVIDLVTAAPLTNLSMLNWRAVTGANGYTVNFTDGTSQKSTTNSLVLQKALTPGTQLGYSVQATGVSNNVVVTGPSSPLAFVPTNITNVSWVSFDGKNVSLAWNGVAGALSYNVFVFDNSDTPAQVYSGSTSETSLSFSITPAEGKEYTAYVQPVMSTGTGLRGTAMPLFNSGIFISQQPSSAAYPYVYVAQSMSALGSSGANPPAQTVTLYLPQLGATPDALGNTPITIDPFTIEPSGQPALPYKLTIAASAVAWTFNTVTVRPVLQQAYVNFLKTIEKPGNNLSGATPYGIALVQSAIACALPQTFAEQLYYNFGFSTSSAYGAAYIDLRPGMILRVAASDYINIAQSGLPSWITGYAGATIMDFEIGSYPAAANWRTGFDAFLNTLSAQGALTVNTPAISTGSAQAGLAGAVDLYYQQFLQPFYRLYIPSAINIPWGTGTNSTQSNFTLVAAAKYADLQATTINPSNNPTAYFRGRAIVEVMIKVMVNGNERLVPVGTSLGNLLEQLGMRPAAASALFKQLRIYRSVIGAITNTDPTLSLGPQLELHLNWNGFPVYGTGNGLNAMSIPLLPGDQVFTDKTGS